MGYAYQMSLANHRILWQNVWHGKRPVLIVPAQAGSPTPDCPVYSQGSNIFNDITWKTNFFLTIVAGQMVKKYNVNRFKGKFSNEKKNQKLQMFWFMLYFP